GPRAHLPRARAARGGGRPSAGGQPRPRRDCRAARVATRRDACLATLPGVRPARRPPDLPRRRAAGSAGVAARADPPADLAARADRVSAAPCALRLVRTAAAILGRRVTDFAIAPPIPPMLAKAAG